LQKQITIQPEPSYRTVSEDNFGNPCTRLEFNYPHGKLLVVAEMEVEVIARDVESQFESSLAWEELVKACSYQGHTSIDAAFLAALPFRFESPFVHLKHHFSDYAQDCFVAKRPVLLAIKALMNKIYHEFSFDPEATHIGTPLLEVLEKKRGVCQDFAHLMLACLRSLGLPARYVSGYLLTNPPEGQARLIGADASHAWISAYCPQVGWVDFDPTNNVIPSVEHITVSWGRDFSDVSPLRGVILGGGKHDLAVRVTVMPVE
jgi:transglutaminase-like putative cysteine protease